MKNLQKFNITVEEVLKRQIEVEANSYEEAITKVQEMYSNEEIVLDSSDFCGKEIF